LPTVAICAPLLFFQLSLRLSFDSSNCHASGGSAQMTEGLDVQSSAAGQKENSAVGMQEGRKV